MRPRYPPELFADLVALAGIPAQGRILEVGPGTGIATLPLAELGYRITAVELGASLAALAREKLAPFERVEVVTASFEDWPLPVERFDLVLSATAWHWIDPAVRYAKAAEALRPGGALAIARYDHVASPDDGGFFERSRACYERYTPGEAGDVRLPEAREVGVNVDGLVDSGLFGAPETRTYVVDGVYSSKRYLELLSTFSNHLQLDDETRRAFLTCVGSVIDAEFGGRIRRRLLHQLVVARTD